jgi:hypothetical protein
VLLTEIHDERGWALIDELVGDTSSIKARWHCPNCPKRGKMHRIKMLAVAACFCVLVACVATPEPKASNWGDNPDGTRYVMRVELLNVKEVNGKYRYFCRVFNSGNGPFKGEVDIDTVNAKGDAVGGSVFSFDKPIEPGLGRVVYFDQHTGPSEIDGKLGIASVRLHVRR